MLGKPTIRTPVTVDPTVVKIAVELENHTAQLIEFDQKSTLTGMYPEQIARQFHSFDFAYSYVLILHSDYTKFMPKLEFDGRRELCITIL